eukprot:scaffold50371_cov27-Cyclotella_meneghiniana.AAC.1
MRIDGRATARPCGTAMPRKAPDEGCTAYGNCAAVEANCLKLDAVPPARAVAPDLFALDSILDSSSHERWCWELGVLPTTYYLLHLT